MCIRFQVPVPETLRCLGNEGTGLRDSGFHAAGQKPASSW